MNKKILLERFREFIREKKLILPASYGKVLLAVSGGMDSVVMTHLFSESEYDFGIAHCNFSLRGEESDGDAEFVEKLAMKYKKTFHLKRFETQVFADENDYSIQEAARTLRYKWFNDLIKKNKYQGIATAHHLDDSIETFFINLLRGTGTAGLRGIPVVNLSTFRPLLFAKRKEIEEYALENNIEYREDSSNASDDYLRNRIRHHILPVIKENAEGFEDRMGTLMEDFSLINEILKTYMNFWKINNLRRDESGNYLLPIEKILQEDHVVSFLSLLLYSFGITGIDCEQVLSSDTVGKIFHAKGCTILRDRKYLVLRIQHDDKAKSYSISTLPAEIKTRNVYISIRSEERKDSDPTTDKNNLQQIDGEKLSFPLTVRPWKPGDYFFPLGMKGKKKISDFYTDQKINRFEKDKIYLLLSGNDIVCILGHRIDDRFKITPSTKKILSIELNRL